MKKFCCYILGNNVDKRTYVGMTNDFHHRFRAHSGLIKGGARATSMISENGRWHPVAQIIGFPDTTSVLQFEYCMKRKMNAYRNRLLNLDYRKKLSQISNNSDIKCPRVNILLQTLSLQNWTKNAIPSNQVPLTIVWYTDRYRPHLFAEDFLSQYHHINELIHPGIIDECTVQIYEEEGQIQKPPVTKPFD